MRKGMGHTAVNLLLLLQIIIIYGSNTYKFIALKRCCSIHVDDEDRCNTSVETL